MPNTNTNIIFLNGTNYVLYGSGKKDEDAIICNVLNDVYNRRLKEHYDCIGSKYSEIEIEEYFHFDKDVKMRLHNFEMNIFYTLYFYIQHCTHEITNFQYIKFFTMGQHSLSVNGEIYPKSYSLIPTETRGAKLERFKQVANALVGCYWRFWCNEM